MCSFLHLGARTYIHTRLALWTSHRRRHTQKSHTPLSLIKYVIFLPDAYVHVVYVCAIRYSNRFDCELVYVYPEAISRTRGIHNTCIRIYIYIYCANDRFVYFSKQTKNYHCTAETKTSLFDLCENNCSGYHSPPRERKTIRMAKIAISFSTIYLLYL